MKPVVGIIMGSKSDIETMELAAKALEEFGVAYEFKVVSAHRTPELMVEYANSARSRGLKVIIAGAGGAAHLPGMVASLTTLPVIGIPIQTRALSGVDSLFSIVQMPAGIPVATVAIGNGRNAGLLALRILSINDEELAYKLDEFAEDLKGLVDEMNRQVERTYSPE
jgi:phosphoribosylaminoimidazole carboxylase PurE protein